MTTPFWRRSSFAAMAALAAGVLVTLYVGHSQRNFLFDYDTRFWFTGGVMWLRGESPYAHGPFVQSWTQQFGEPPVFPSGFVYPGTILPLSLLLGSFPWGIARWVMRGLNLAAYGGTLLVLLRFLVGNREISEPPGRRDLWIGLAAAAPGAALTIFQGQVALLVTLGIVLTWSGLKDRRTGFIVAGMLLACIKPQVSLVPQLFLLARWWDRRAWWGIGASAAVALAAFLWSSPGTCVADLAGSLAEHARQDFNSLAHYDSLPGLLGNTPLARLALWGGMLVGCASALALAVRARRAGSFPYDIRSFQIVLVVTAATMPIHRYDLAIYMPLLATAWALGSMGRGVLLLLVVLGHGMAHWLAMKIVDPASGPPGAWLRYMDLASTLASVFAAAELVVLLAWRRVDRDDIQGQFGSPAAR